MNIETQPSTTQNVSAYLIPLASSGRYVMTDSSARMLVVDRRLIEDKDPPVIFLAAPDLHRIVDSEEVKISGYSKDITSGVAAVTVAGQPVEVDFGGHFSKTVPLTVGVNSIPVTAQDWAGVSNTVNVWMLRLITDRTQTDVDRVTALLGKNWNDFTQEEKDYWNGVVKGAYNTSDMNRVGTAVAHISDYLISAGYNPDTSPKIDWEESDAPTIIQAETYLGNVSKLKTLLPVTNLNVPLDMQNLTFKDANNIESILVSIDRAIPLMECSLLYSGESFSGEF